MNFRGNRAGFMTAAANLLSAWGDAGLEAEAVAPLAELLATDERVGKEYAAMRNGSGGSDVVDGVVNGTLSLSDAVRLDGLGALAEQPVSLHVSTSRLDALLDRCRSRVSSLAERWLRANGKNLVEQIGAALAEVDQERETLSVAVEGLGTDRDALAAGAAKAKAWARMQELTERRSNLWTAGRAIRRFGFSEQVDAVLV